MHDWFDALFGYNALVGFLLLAVLLLFVASLAWSIASCFKPEVKPNQNLSYVATAIAGLVLSVASGVLGKPAEIPGPGSPKSAVTDAQPAAPPTTQSPPTAASTTSKTPLELQREAFSTMYSWTYVVVGLVCLVVFMTRSTPDTNELVKHVGLTTLGFVITLVPKVF